LACADAKAANMALPKKGTRRIHVDGGDYWWIVSPDDGYLVLVVESAKGPRRRLLVYTGYRDAPIPDPRTGGHIPNPQMRITPALVRRCIVTGLAAGWNSSQPGQDFCLTHDGDDIIVRRS
jgi:hypothetical protein